MGPSSLLNTHLLFTTRLCAHVTITAFILISCNRPKVHSRKKVHERLNRIDVFINHLEFDLHSEDVSAIHMKHSEVESRRSSRASTITTAKVRTFDEVEIEELRLKCWKPLKQMNNLHTRPPTLRFSGRKMWLCRAMVGYGVPCVCVVVKCGVL